MAAYLRSARSSPPGIGALRHGFQRGPFEAVNRPGPAIEDHLPVQRALYWRTEVGRIEAALNDPRPGTVDADGGDVVMAELGVAVSLDRR